MVLRQYGITFEADDVLTDAQIHEVVSSAARFVHNVFQHSLQN